MRYKAVINFNKESSFSIFLNFSLEIHLQKKQRNGKIRTYTTESIKL